MTTYIYDVILRPTVHVIAVIAPDLAFAEFLASRVAAQIAERDLWEGDVEVRLIRVLEETEHVTTLEICSYEL